MRKNNKVIGKFELWCAVFNSLIYKMFTAYPRRFSEISQSGSWVTAIFVSLVFIAALVIICALAGRNDAAKRALSGKTASVILTVYFIFSALYALISFASVLEAVAYPRSSKLFIMAILGIATLLIAVRGLSASSRIHAIAVPILAAGAILIIAASFTGADFYNLFPILGSGGKNVFGRGLETLFIYSDVLVIPAILQYVKEDVRPVRTVIFSAVCAAAFNVLIMLAFSLNFTYETAQTISVPMYPLSKLMRLGRFLQQLDTLYISVMTASGVLYLSLALSLIAKCADRAFSRSRRAWAAILLICFVPVLTSCADMREVEQTAYIIALGIDKGENARFNYTFQFSNPMEMGENSMQGTKEESENESVNNVSVEADDYYIALSQVSAQISKIPNMSQIKLIAVSGEVAREGVMEHAALFMREREVRPATHLCVAPGGAGEFLRSVKPSLEESTARYYELLLSKERLEYAPIVTLGEFFGAVVSGAEDAVLPRLSDGELKGIAFFSDDKMTEEADTNFAFSYRLLSGSLKRSYVLADGKTVLLTSKGKPEITIDNNTVNVNITLYASLVRGSGEFLPQTENVLVNEAQNFFNLARDAGCDALGVGLRKRRQCLTIAEFERQNFKEVYKNMGISVKIDLKERKNIDKIRKKDNQ